MKLVVSRLATRRLLEIAAYIHERNPVAARHVQKAIRKAFALLQIYPDAGRAIERNVRRFPVPRLPYLIYYRIDEAREAVLIITVRHAAMRREGELMSAALPE